MAFRRLFLLLGLIGGHVYAAPKTGIATYDFSATGRWNAARVTNLQVVPSPIFVAQPNGVIRAHRYATQENHVLVGLDFRVDGEALQNTNLYQKLQSYSLKEMLKRGYISKTLFDDVSYATGIWRPDQIRFAVDWIEMPIAEAKRLYGGNIPWDRVIGGPERNFIPDTETWVNVPPEWWVSKWPGDEPLRLVRTSIMVGLGQVMDLRTGAVPSLPLSWETYPDPHPLAFGEARKRPENIPLMAEFSRALAGDAVTGGSLTEPIRVMLSLLETEARLRQGKTAEYLIFAHALDKKHARYFQTAFKMKPFTAEARQAILDHRFDFATLPDGRAEDERSVTITTLAEVTGKVVSTALLSDWHESRLPFCGGVRGRTEAFQRAFFEGVWSHLQFPSQVTAAPVCVSDFSPVLMIPAFEQFIRWQINGEEATALMRTMGNVDWDPNFMAPYFIGQRYTFYPQAFAPEKVQTQPLGVVRIDNLDPKAATQFPEYLPNVLLHVYRRQREAVLQATPQARETFFTYIRSAAEAAPEAVGITRPKLPASLDVDTVLDHVLYLVSTGDPEVRRTLEDLGGFPIPVDSYGIPELEVVEGDIRVKKPIITQAANVAFRGSQIRALTRHTSHIPVNCPRHLVDFFLLQAATQL